MKPTLHARTSLKPSLRKRTTLNSTIQARTSSKPTLEARTTLNSTLQARTSSKPSLQARTTLNSTFQARTSSKPSLEARTSLSFLTVLLLAALLLSACGERATAPNPTPTATHTQLPPTPTLTPEPLKVLNICIAEDPGSLYRYDGHTTLAEQSVLAALYDGLFETSTGEGSYEPGILAVIPAVSNGEISSQPVSPKQGQRVVDAYGHVKVLKPGVLLALSKTTGAPEPIEWSYDAEIVLDQVSLTYTLRSDLFWTDGAPLTAQDVVFSYQLALESELPSQYWALERTASLLAEDEQTIVWTGLPGFVPADIARFFWAPLPSHLLAELDPADLADTDEAAWLPPGWGPYHLVDREEGQALHLLKNPYYYRASEALPAFDILNFLVVPELETALSKLANGECQVLDKSYHLESLDLAELDEIAQTASLYMEDWQLIAQLVFGITPASYDDGYSIAAGDRPDFFGDLRTRQALAACLQREESIALSILKERLPQSLDLNTLQGTPSPFDPQALLDEVGWQIDAQDPSGLRSALNVPNVPDGTPLKLNLATGQSELDLLAANSIVERLVACGAAVDHQVLPLNELYAPGPQGLLFGRNFDLALVSWQQGSSGFCGLYTSDQIPQADNYWIGTNLAGFADPAYDLACAQLNAALPGEFALCGDCAVLENSFPAVPLLPQISLWAVNGMDLAGSRVWDKLELWSQR